MQRVQVQPVSSKRELIRLAFHITYVRCTATPPHHTQQDNTHNSKFLRHLIAGSLRAQVSNLFARKRRDLCVEAKFRDSEGVT